MGSPRGRSDPSGDLSDSEGSPPDLGTPPRITNSPTKEASCEERSLKSPEVKDAPWAILISSKADAQMRQAPPPELQGHRLQLTQGGGTSPLILETVVLPSKRRRR